MQMLQTFGLAVVILFAIGVAGWRMAGWFGKEIVIPFRDKVLTRWLTVMDKMEASVEKVDRNVDQVLALMKQQVGLQRVQTEKVSEAADKLKEAAKPANGSSAHG